MNLYTILLQAHSGFRFIVMVLLLVAILQSLVGWFGNRPYTEINRKLNLFTLISAHIQFSKTAMQEHDTRYWTVEHITMMVFAIALITVGHIRSKKVLAPAAKHRTIAIFYLLALLVIVLAIIQSLRPFFGVSH